MVARLIYQHILERQSLLLPSRLAQVQQEAVHVSFIQAQVDGLEVQIFLTQMPTP